MPNRRTLALALSILLFAGLLPAAGRPRPLAPGPAASAGMDPAELERGVALFRAAIERDELRGAVLMVARRGTIVLHEALGWRHHAYRLPMEKDTLFRMASNTKPVVATAIMMLEQEGRLSVDDRAGKFVPGFDTYRSREITLAHLLSHTSGLRIAPIFLPFDEEQKKGETPTLRGAAGKFGREGPAFAPGTTYSYSNPGYNTLGAVIEAASGRPLEAFLKSRIYDPLGMTDTLNHEDPAKLARMATVYRGRKAGGKVEWTQGFTPGDAPDFPLVRASGGMISTAMDYARFLQMFLDQGAAGNGPLLSEAGVRKMISPHARVSDNSSYGFGWMVRADGTFGHGGSDGTEAWVDPARDLFGIVFTQSPGGVIPVEEFRKIVAAACR